MPEGDTLFRIATTLRRALAGEVLTAFASPLAALADARLAGQRVERVEALGKNLLITFEDGRALRTHLRMEGSWHLYRPGEAWQKPTRGARAVLETARFVAVCFHAPTVELLPAGHARGHAPLAALGPDLLAPVPDLDEALARLALDPARPVGVALLDQRAVAGVGNVYKSEGLFLAGLDPFAAVGAVPPGALRALLESLARLMRRNLSGAPRVTRRALDGGHLWVYGRSGEPCLRCGHAVDMRRQGDAGRSTYFCARCQGVAARAG